MSLYKNGPLRNKLISFIRGETGIPKSIVSDEELIKKQKGLLCLPDLKCGWPWKNLRMSLKK